MKSGIYQILHAGTGKSYVGSAKNLASRLASHRCLLRQRAHPNGRLQNAWNKYGEGAFAFKTILRCAPKDLIMYEQLCIDGLGTARHGYNILPVAGSALGYKHSAQHLESLRGNQHALGYRHSAETLARLSEASKGNQHGKGWIPPEEWRKNLSDKLRGRKQSPEHVKSRIAAHVGAKRSDEAKANMRAAWERRKAKAAAL